MTHLPRTGFAGPFRAFEEHEMRALREKLDAAVFSCDGPDSRSRYQSRHLDCDDVLRVCASEAIVERVRAILGDGMVLWRTNFFPKPPGAGEFGWHSDRGHWRDLLDPMINITAWLAIDPATRAAGCLEFAASESDTANPIAMPLEPGEFVLFNQDALHRSGANRTAAPRLGLAIRFTLEHVAIKKDERLPAAHRVITFAGLRA